jgi:hypothetical protein
VNHLTGITELPNCRFIGNVSLGRHISLAQLQTLYDAVVLVSTTLCMPQSHFISPSSLKAYGAQEDHKLGIPGEASDRRHQQSHYTELLLLQDLPGVYSAKSFYGWYNGFPAHIEVE